MQKLKGILHHWFIPGSHNNYRGRFISHTALLTYAVFTLTLLIVAKTSQSYLSRQILGVATDIKTEDLLNDTNTQRTKNGLEPLVMNDKLSQAAQMKADHMFINNYWAHFSPQGDTPWEFIKRAGYEYEYAGENLAKNFLYSQNVVDAWMKSPTHRENILRPEFTNVGFAIENGVLQGEETTLVVQMFGKPLHPAVASDTSTKNALPGATAVGDGQAVLAQKDQRPVISLPRNTILLVFIALLAIALVLDLYVASRLKIIHMHGKTLAHLIFIGAVTLGALIYLVQGSII
jgi:uncharacterized protein YkwD